ncbi:MAG: chromosome segregation protein ParM, partial [Cyanobacteriota bacterium]
MTVQPSAATPMNSAATPINSVKPATTTVNTRSATGVTKSIISVDLGRTSTKTCVSREPNNVVFIPANVKQLSMEQVRGGIFEARATDPLLDMWLEYQGKGYAVGQLAADFG